MLGSNIGDSRLALEHAVKHLQSYAGKIVAQSSIYETAPWGMSDTQNNYLNQAIALKTYKSPGQLINTCLSIEKMMGRVRTEVNAPRLIDLDILLIDEMVVEQPDLFVPHPRLHLRKFCLLPLNEIAAEVVHPVLGHTVSELLALLDDELEVVKLD